MNVFYHFPLLRRYALRLFPALFAGMNCAYAQQALPLPSELHDPMANVPQNAAKATSSLPELRATAVYIENSGALVPSDSALYSYTPTPESSRDQLINYRWNSGAWKIFNRYSYTYDANNYNTQTELQVPATNGSGTYVNLARYNYTYNTAGFQTALFYEVWATHSNTYINGINETYTLDVSNQMIEMVRQIWNVANSVWDNSVRITQVWNAQGMVTDYTQQAWDPNTSTWQNRKRYVNTMDVTGKHILVQNHFTWGGGWANAKRITNVLTASGDVQTATTEYYDIPSASWVPGTQEDYTYNTSGDCATDLIAPWDQTSMSYLNYTKTTNTYNTDKQLKIADTRSWVSGNWAIDSGSGRTINYYDGENTGPTAGVPTATTQDIHISPIPANDVLHIALGKDAQQAEGMLLDLQGRVQLQFSIGAANAYTADVAVSTLPAGIYLLSIRDQAGMNDRRIITVTH